MNSFLLQLWRLNDEVQHFLLLADYWHLLETQ